MLHKTVVVLTIGMPWETEHRQKFFDYIDQAIANGKIVGDPQQEFLEELPHNRIERTWATLEYAQEYVDFVQANYADGVVSIEIVPV